MVSTSGGEFGGGVAGVVEPGGGSSRGLRNGMLKVLPVPDLGVNVQWEIGSRNSGEEPGFGGYRDARQWKDRKSCIASGASLGCKDPVAVTAAEQIGPEIDFFLTVVCDRLPLRDQFFVSVFADFSGQEKQTPAGRRRYR